MDVKCFFVCVLFSPLLPWREIGSLSLAKVFRLAELCRKAIAATHYEAIITLRMADALREAAAAGISTSEAKAERMPKIICYCITHVH